MEISVKGMVMKMERQLDLISVIVPVYQVEKYLEKCVKSIRKQSYQNLEIILVEDGSPDNCSVLCDALAKIDNRIRVIHKSNGGLSSARNAGLDIATGSYISFIDSDDYIHADMLLELYEKMISLQCEISICNYYVLNGEKVNVGLPSFVETQVYNSEHALLLLIEDEIIKNYACNKLYKSELFEEIRYPDGRNYEDISIMYLLFSRCNRICQIPMCGYYYLIREDSISCNNSWEKWRKNSKDMVLGMWERYEYFIEYGNNTLKEKSFANLIERMTHNLYASYRVSNWKNVDSIKDFLKEHKKEIEMNLYLTDKNKRLAYIYSAPHLCCRFYVFLQLQKEKYTILKRKTYHFKKEYDTVNF